MIVTILGALASCGIQLPLYWHRVPTGFPLLAADQLEQKIFLAPPRAAGFDMSKALIE